MGSGIPFCPGDEVIRHKRRRGAYENMRLDEAAACMKELMTELSDRRIIYGEEALIITMTFGLTEGNAGKIEHIIRDADAKLYQGKNSGRNRIVYEAV